MQTSVEQVRVLLVEDDDEDYELTRRQLDRLSGFRCAVERCSDFAASAQRLLTTPYDVVLLDYQLDGGTGLQLLANGRGVNLSTPAILITGFGHALHAEAVAAGVVDFLEKGKFDAAQLERAIRHALDRRRTETALRAAHAEAERAHARLDLVLESITDAFFALDAAWRFTYVNGAGAALVRRPRTELLGRRVSEVLPLRLMRSHLAQCRRAARERTPVTFEAHVAPLDAWFSVHAYPADGGLTLHVKDITRLRESEERFRAIQEASPDGCVLLRSVRDASGRLVDLTCTYANAAGGRLLGRTSEELLATSLRTGPFGRGLGTLFDDYVRVVESGAPHQREIVWHEHGTERAFRIVAVKLGDGLAVSFSDTTDRRRAELALLRSEIRFRSIMENSADMVAVLDAEGRIEYASPSYERGLGYSPDALRGRIAFDLLHPEDVARAQRTLQDLAATRERPAALELRVRHREGSWRTFDIAVRNLLHDEHVAGILVTGHDVTEQRSLEAQFRQAQKMEAIGQLAGGVAHDFNNLLTVISSYADVILSGLHAADPIRRDLEEIQKAVTRAVSLTRQLLIFSRRQVLQPRPLDLNGVIQELDRMLRRLIGEDIEVVVRCAPDPCPLLADPGQLEQVLLNLALNARDAMPAGGTLTIATDDVEVDAAQARRHRGLSSGRYVMLTVSDTGVGMESATLARIFEPFFTTKAAGKGTGLGLSTVYGIVEQAHGAIDVDSVPGRGTTFRIYFPRSETDWESTPALPRAPGALPRGTERILLVEDEPAVRRITRASLERRGYRVLEAGDGVEALRLAERHGEEIDLVVTDLVMPRMGGRELVERLGALGLHPPALFLSGYTDDAIIRQGTLPEGTAFVEKPLSMEALERIMRALLEGSAGTTSVRRA